MRRVLVTWVVALVVVVAAGGGAVVALNATAFGPGAFVRVYLDALARGDAVGALSLPGVEAGDASDLLLDDAALSGLTDLQQVSDVDAGGGHHRVAFSWSSPVGSGTSTFDVERIGSRFGVFAEWGFATSPVATVSLAVQHDPRFVVNGLSTTTGLDSSAPADYAVLVPGAYTFGHDTTFLMAKLDSVLATEVGQKIDATVDVQAAPAFTADLDGEVRKNLDACTTQQVLFPTGCPFGQTITDRVVSDPVWSMVDYPVLDIQPGGQFGTWQVPPTEGTAHLVVDVQSLFDGSVAPFDQDVPFEVSYTMTIDGNALQVTAF